MHRRELGWKVWLCPSASEHLHQAWVGLERPGLFLRARSVYAMQGLAVRTCTVLRSSLLSDSHTLNPLSLEMETAKTLPISVARSRPSVIGPSTTLAMLPAVSAPSSRGTTASGALSAPKSADIVVLWIGRKCQRLYITRVLFEMIGESGVLTHRRFERSLFIPICCGRI